MEVALYARVPTRQQQHEGTIESQRRVLKHHIQHHGWALLPEHEYIDDGISGTRLGVPVQSMQKVPISLGCKIKDLDECINHLSK